MYSIKMVMGFNMLTLHIIRFGKKKMFPENHEFDRNFCVFLTQHTNWSLFFMKCLNVHEKSQEIMVKC